MEAPPPVCSNQSSGFLPDVLCLLCSTSNQLLSPVRSASFISRRGVLVLSLGASLIPALLISPGVYSRSLLTTLLDAQLNILQPFFMTFQDKIPTPDVCTQNRPCSARPQASCLRLSPGSWAAETNPPALLSLHDSVQGLASLWTGLCTPFSNQFTAFKIGFLPPSLQSILHPPVPNRDLSLWIHNTVHIPPLSNFPKVHKFPK